MHPKVLRLTRLIEGGYRLEEITSDAHAIEARLSHLREGHIVVTFDRGDAEALLYDETAFDRPTRARSRFLITRPLV